MKIYRLLLYLILIINFKSYSQNEKSNFLIEDYLENDNLIQLSKHLNNISPLIIKDHFKIQYQWALNDYYSMKFHFSSGYNLNPITGTKFIIVENLKLSKSAVIDTTGKILFPEKSNKITFINNMFFISSPDNLKSIMYNSSLEKIGELRNSIIGGDENYYIFINESSETGVINHEGKILFKSKWISYIDIDLKNRIYSEFIPQIGYGVKNFDGKVLVPYYHNSLPKLGSFIILRKPLSKSGCYNSKSNKVILNYDFDEIDILKNNTVIGTKGNKSFLFDENGKIIFDFFNYYKKIDLFDKQYLIVTTDTLVRGGQRPYKALNGLIDYRGKLMFPIAFTELNYCKWGVFCASKFDSLYLFNTEGKLLYKYKGNNDVMPYFYDGIAIINSISKRGIIDTNGVLSFSYTDIDFRGEYKNKLFLIREGNKYGYMDKYGIKKVPLQFDFGRDFNESVATVYEKDKGFYFIDSLGVNKFKQFYERAGSFCQGLAPVKKNGKWGFINQNGEVVIPYKFDKVAHFKRSVTKVKEGDLEYAINCKGEKDIYLSTQISSFITRWTDESTWDSQDL